MSSTGQTTSSAENVKLIIDALADYAKETGIDLSKNPFAANLEQWRSPEDILQLLEEREKAFKDYRARNRTLINCLSPVVNVFHGFSGILSKAAGLIHFPPAGVLFAGIDTLLGAAGKVSSSYDALFDLFEHLGSFVKRLDIYTKIDLTPIMVDMIVKITVELLSVFALATKQITQGRIKKFVKKLLDESEIEAVLQRLDRLTQDEARIGVAQTLGVVHGLVGNVKLIMEDREASMDSIRQDLGALHRELIEMNKTRRDQLQRDVKDWLSPPDPSTNHIFVSNARHDETAAWFFKSEKLKEWNTRGSLLWIHGKPGAGKSTLLSAVIEDIEDKHAIGLAKTAYYYFDFRDSKKQDRYGLLSSLVLQLSAESDSCSNILSKLYSGNNRVRKPTIIALKNCIKEMLSQPGQGPIYIVVDGLDECPNSSGMPSARREVLELIKELVDLKLPNVHICVASRPEMDIRMVLESLEPLKIFLDDEIGQMDDIIAYIKHMVHSNSMPEWTEEDQSLVINTLSQNANGMFQWVACHIDKVLRCYPDDIRSTLADLPKDLDETYERTLLDIDEQKRKYTRRLLQCLLVSVRPLRVEELAEIFAVQFDAISSGSSRKASRPRNAEWAVLSACSSLITIINQENNQIVQFAHFSVKELLTSERLAQAEERLSYYHILPDPAHTTLAYASLSVLLQLDEKIDGNTIGRFPLAPYAARHWVHHALYRNVSTHIKELMERLFDPTDSHFAAWVWLYDIDRYWTEPMSTIHPTPPEAEPLYYASLCGFRGLAEYLITTHSPDINSIGGSHATPLHAASVKGHLEVASLLLENGADPDSRDYVYQAPLHLVSQGGQLVVAQSSLEIVRLLIKSGAYVNARDDRGQTPLHTAASHGFWGIAELLLDSGASLDVRNDKRETPLNVACQMGKLDVSRFLIDRGSDINSRDKYGWTPLHSALGYGHIDVARLLAECVSDVDARNQNNRTPLFFALLRGYLDVARLLMDRGADVSAREEHGWTALHRASEDGLLDVAKFLIDQGADVDSKNDAQTTPLQCASRNGFLDVARFLIESDAAVSARDVDGWTPFHTASYHGHLHVVKFLLGFGIDADIRTSNGETSLYLASMNGELDVVSFLIEKGADIHTRNEIDRNYKLNTTSEGLHNWTQMTQMTPLDVASIKGKVEVGRFLIDQGADMNARDSEGEAPLHFASGFGHLNMARLLLDHGVDPNVQGDDLWSPLHLASANGHLHVAELLIQRGATVDIANNQQETSLYQAVLSGEVAIVRLLIDHGASLQIANSNGWTLLHAASERGHLGVVKLLLRWDANVDGPNNANKTAAEVALESGQAEVANFIAEYKADANIRNKIRSTTWDAAQRDTDEDDCGGYKINRLLFIAAQNGNIDLVKSLVEQGADINTSDRGYQTPLHRAAVGGKLDVVCFLIERGAEVDRPEGMGWTPLHMASSSGHIEVSRVLIAHGANVNARQQTNYTPLSLSAQYGHLGTVKLLLEHGADIHAITAGGETPYQLSLGSGDQATIDFLYERSADVTSPWDVAAA